MNLPSSTPTTANNKNLKIELMILVSLITSSVSISIGVILLNLLYAPLTLPHQMLSYLLGGVAIILGVITYNRGVHLEKRAQQETGILNISH
jgi:hypothetical protein